jgi:hypothetical protein
MKIPQEDTDLFYKLHPAVLYYVNQRLSIIPNIKSAESFRNSGLENIAQAWTKLWSRTDFIDEFVSDNPERFSSEELSFVLRWKHARQGKFYIYRHLKKYTVFLTEEEPTKAYGVLSLTDELSDSLPYLPIYTEAVLLPFRDYILYDGILRPSAVTFGRNFCLSLDEVLLRHYEPIK